MKWVLWTGDARAVLGMTPQHGKKYEIPDADADSLVEQGKAQFCDPPGRGDVPPDAPPKPEPAAKPIQMIDETPVKTGPKE